VLAAVLLVALPLAGLVAGSRLRSPAQATADSAPPHLATITAAVERRVLTDRVIARGDVVIAAAVPVLGPSLPADVQPVVTDLRRGVGAQVAEGDVVAVVAGRPIFVISGPLPFYRDLRPPMSGPDVAQLQDALERLGLGAGDESGQFGPGTQRALDALYRGAGFEQLPGDPEAGAALLDAEDALAVATESFQAAQRATVDSDQNGGVVAAEAAVRAAERAYGVAVTTAAAAEQSAADDIETARRQLAVLEASSSASPDEVADARSAVDSAVRSAGVVHTEQDAAIANAADEIDIARATLADTAVAVDSARATEDGGSRAAQLPIASAARAVERLRLVAGPTAPRGEIVAVPALPAPVIAVHATVGTVAIPSTGSTPGGPADEGILVIGAGDPVVRAVVPSPASASIRVGDIAGLGEAGLSGAVTQVAAGEQDLVTGGRGRLVTVAPSPAFAVDRVGANIVLTFVTASSDAEVLVVPLPALAADGDGNVSVRLLDKDGDISGKVAVRVLMSASSGAAVEPIAAGALVEGDRVVVMDPTEQPRA
jgi:peptidoglycan hydrolase-like protein with peptidoglycan-binding domain